MFFQMYLILILTCGFLQKVEKLAVSTFSDENAFPSAIDIQKFSKKIKQLEFPWLASYIVIELSFRPFAHENQKTGRKYI